MAKDYYQILEIDRKADEKEIKSAFRKLARKYHPDVNPNDPEADRRFKEINAAYEVLRDPEKRKLYDRHGDNWESASKMGDFMGGEGFRSGQAGGYRVEDFGGQGSGGFGSLFEQIFHGFGGGGFQQPQRTVPPANVEQTITVSLDEIDQGLKRQLSYTVEDVCTQCNGAGMVVTTNGQPASCPACRGAGMVATHRKVQVSVPAGLHEGKKLRVPGGGGRGSSGKQGDLFVKVVTSPHPTFKRSGDDLTTSVDVDYVTAVLGGKATVRTLKGQGAATVPSGTQPGQTLRLKGQGLTKMSGGRGDLLAKVNVVVPKDPPEKEKELLLAIRESRGGKA